MTATLDIMRPVWLDRIGVPAWITAPDRTILHMNARAESLFGRKASECEGRRCFDVFGGRTHAASPTGTLRPFCREHCAVQEALKQGRELPASDLCVLASGSRFWIHLLAIPVEGGDSSKLVLHCALPADKERRLEDYFEHVARRSPHPSCPLCLDSLTPREQDVLRLLAEDLTLGAIAERLGVSYVTVRNHVQHMLAKLCAHSIAEAIAVYLLEQTDQKSTVMPRRWVSPSASGSKR